MARKNIRCCSSILLKSFVAAFAFILSSAFSMAQNATGGNNPLIIVKKEAYPGPDVVPQEVQSFLSENAVQQSAGPLGDTDPEAVPEINNCPDDQTVECFSDVGHTVSELEYTINCSENGVIIIYEPAGILETGSCPGTEYVVTYVVWDECGNSTSCDQIFTLDNEGPQITSCPEGGEITDPSEAVSNVEALDFTFSCPEDPLCADILVEVALIEETDICLGNTYTYVYTITDGCGRTDQCEQVFTLPPAELTVECPEDAVVECSFDINPTEEDVSISGDLSYSVDISDPTLVSGNEGCPGAMYEVVYTVTDECQNEATCTRNYTVENDGPIITAPVDIEVECSNDIVADIEGVVVSTFCEGFGEVLADEPVVISGDGDCNGSVWEINYNFTDECGGTSSDSQLVTIAQAGPTIVAPLDIVIQCSEDAVPDVEGAFIEAPCGVVGEVTADEPILVEGDGLCNGSVWEINYAVEDECGGFASDVQLVTLDIDGPTIAAPADIIIGCPDDAIADPDGVEITTSCGLLGEVEVEGPILTEGDGICVGSVWQFVYTITDECGGTAQDFQLVTLDNDGPTIIAPVDIFIECPQDLAPDEENVTVTTSCEILSDVIAGEPVLVEGDGTCDGSVWEYVYTVTDECGGEASDSQFVTLDVPDPTILAPADVTIECATDVLPDPDGVTFSTGCGILGDIIADDPVIIDGDGVCDGSVFEVTYTIQDICGGVSTDVQLFTIDTDAPTIAAPLDIVVDCAEDVLPNVDGVTFSTPCGIIGDVTSDGPVLVDGDGICDGSVFEITYTIIDECGGTASDIQLITLDLDDPTIVAPTDIFVACPEDIIPDGNGATITTGCDILGEITTSDPELLDGDGFCDGSVFEVTYTLEDVCGGLAFDAQLFTLDLDGPTIEAPEDVTIECASDAAADLDGVEFSTSCDLGAEVTAVGPNLLEGDGFCDGSLWEFVYTVTDDCGETASDVQLVTIENDGPTIIAPEDVTIECAADAAADLDGVVVSSSCDLDSDVSVEGPNLIEGDGFCDASVWEFVYTVTDDCGRTASDVQVVTIENDGPTIVAPDDVAIECAADAAADLDGVVASTSCGLDSDVSVEGPNLIEGDGFCDGSIWEFVYTVTDDCGRSASDVQVVTIENNGPTVVAPDDVIIECAADAAADLDGVVVTTACGLESDVTADGPNLIEGDGFCDGSIWEFVYTVTDDCGRTATDVQMVTIDNDGPVLNAPADTEVACITDFVGDADLADLTTFCDDDAEVVIGEPVLIEGDGVCTVSMYEVVYSVTDACGRSAEDTQMVTVINSALEVLEEPMDMTVTCYDDINPDPFAIEYITPCNSDVFIQVTPPTQLCCEFDCPGAEYSVTYSLSNTCGQTAEVEQIFTIDNDAPVIFSCGEDMEVDSEEDIEVSIEDVDYEIACGHECEIVISEEAEVIDNGCEGTDYVYTYTVTDNCGRSTSCNRVFTVPNTDPDCQDDDACDDFSIYFAAHGPGVDGSEIYEVTIEDGQADLTFLNNVDFQTHIAFNAADNVLYLVNANGSEFTLYSPLANDILGTVAIEGDIDQLYAVEYRPDNQKLYVGDAGADEIYSVDVTTGATEFFAEGPVEGGDLVYYEGTFYLANRANSELYQIVEGGQPILLGSIPEEVNGMTPNNSGSNFITSNANLNNFVEISSDDGSTLGSFPAFLDGEPYIFINGDLASGCADEDNESELVDSPSTVLPTEVYPNPSDQNTTITFTPAVSARTVVELYDMMGRPVEGLFSRMTTEGAEYRVNVNTAQYEDGVYIYRITNGSHTVTKKIVVSR